MSRELLIEEAKGIGQNLEIKIYKAAFVISKMNIDLILFEYAQQANSSENSKKVMISAVGERLIEIALRLFPDAKCGDKLPLTHVRIDTYKESGKWYDTIEYYTNVSNVDQDRLIAEMKTKAQSGMSFTYEAHTVLTGALNKRLIIVDNE